MYPLIECFAVLPRYSVEALGARGWRMLHEDFWFEGRAPGRNARMAPFRNRSPARARPVSCQTRAHSYTEHTGPRAQNTMRTLERTTACRQAFVSKLSNSSRAAGRACRRRQAPRRFPRIHPRPHGRTLQRGLAARVQYRRSNRISGHSG